MGAPARPGSSQVTMARRVGGCSSVTECFHRAARRVRRASCRPSEADLSAISLSSRAVGSRRAGRPCHNSQSTLNYVEESHAAACARAIQTTPRCAGATTWGAERSGSAALSAFTLWGQKCTQVAARAAAYACVPRPTCPPCSNIVQTFPPRDNSFFLQQEPGLLLLRAEGPWCVRFPPALCLGGHGGPRGLLGHMGPQGPAGGRRGHRGLLGHMGGHGGPQECGGNTGGCWGTWRAVGAMGGRGDTGYHGGLREGGGYTEGCWGTWGAVGGHGKAVGSTGGWWGTWGAVGAVGGHGDTGGRGGLLQPPHLAQPRLLPAPRFRVQEPQAV